MNSMLKLQQAYDEAKHALVEREKQMLNSNKKAAKSDQQPKQNLAEIAQALLSSHLMLNDYDAKI